MPWKRATFVTLLAAAALTGCATSTEPTKETVSETGHSRCEAKSAEFAIGKKGSPELLEQARTKAGAQNARILGPHDMVTLEYRSDRLNLNADDSGVIIRVNCG